MYSFQPNNTSWFWNRKKNVVFLISNSKIPKNKNSQMFSINLKHIEAHIFLYIYTCMCGTIKLIFFRLISDYIYNIMYWIVHWQHSLIIHSTICTPVDPTTPYTHLHTDILYYYFYLKFFTIISLLQQWNIHFSNIEMDKNRRKK